MMVRDVLGSTTRELVTHTFRGELTVLMKHNKTHGSHIQYKYLAFQTALRYTSRMYLQFKENRKHQYWKTYFTARSRGNAMPRHFVLEELT